VTTTTPEPQPLDTWAIIELMGHVTIIGQVTETTLASAPMLRIDRIDGRIQRVSPQALYRLTDVTETEARAAWLAQASWSGSRGLPNALTQGDAHASPDDDEDDPYTEAGHDYQRAEMAREDRRNEDHDDDGDEGDDESEPF